MARGGPQPQVITPDALVERMGRAAMAALAAEAGALAYDTERIDALTLEFEIGGGGGVRATHVYVSRRARHDPLGMRD